MLLVFLLLVLHEQASALLHLLLPDFLCDRILDDLCSLLLGHLPDLVAKVLIESHQALGISVLLIKRIDSIDEYLMLVLSQERNERLGSVPMDLAFVGDISCHFRKQLLVEIDEMIKRSFTDIKRTQRGQKVVSNEEAEEDEVIDHAFQVKCYLHVSSQRLVLEQEVLSQQ